MDKQMTEQRADGVFISPFGNPCVHWDPMQDWEAMARHGGYQDDLMFMLRAREKRRDVNNVLQHSTKCEDVFLRDYETGRCIYCGETFEDVPNSIVAYIEAAGVNPFSESLILEVCSTIFDALINQPWAADRRLCDPMASEDEAND